VFTGATYTASTLDTLVEGLNAAVVTQDFFAIYQDTFGDVRVAIVESDGSETGAGADFTVTDAFIFSDLQIADVSSIISADDFIVA